jgi:hypothetical protein
MSTRDTHRTQRRSLLSLVAGLLALGLGAAASAQGQSPSATPLQAVGLFSLLGDSVQITAAADAPRDTRIERTERQTLDVKNLGLDNIALRGVREALLKAQPQAKISMFRAQAILSPDEQRSVAEGATRGELPAWMVQAIAANKLSHIIMVTRDRGPADMRTGDGQSIGRGTVQGIGFYLDNLFTIKNSENGNLVTGLIAPYVQVRLSLMDVPSGAVLRSTAIRDGRVMTSPESQAAADPWNYLTPTEKATVLRQMLEEGVARNMPELLKAP